MQCTPQFSRNRYVYILGGFSEIIIRLPRTPRDIASEIILFTQETTTTSPGVNASTFVLGWVRRKSSSE